jgi:hypothetical protein
MSSGIKSLVSSTSFNNRASALGYSVPRVMNATNLAPGILDSTCPTQAKQKLCLCCDQLCSRCRILSLSEAVAFDEKECPGELFHSVSEFYVLIRFNASFHSGTRQQEMQHLHKSIRINNAPVMMYQSYSQVNASIYNALVDF